MIIVDYPRQARLKILGHFEIFEAEEAKPWLARVRLPGYEVIVERVLVVTSRPMTGTAPTHYVAIYGRRDSFLDAWARGTNANS
jgi:hypothetical protein